MATQIHGAGPAGQRSPGLDLAIAGYLTENPPAGGGATALNDLTDVDTTGATTGQVLTFDGSEWLPDAPSAGTVTSTSISDSTATGRAVLTAADAATARGAIGAGTSSFSGAYADLSGTPTIPDSPDDIGAAPAAAGVPPGGTAGQALVKASATDYDTEWGDAVGGDAATPHFSGIIRTPLTLAGVSLTNGTTATIASFHPIYIPVACTCEELYVDVSTGEADTVARLGIYTMPGAPGDGGDLVADYGTVATETTGVKSAAGSAWLESGWYLLCVALGPATTRVVSSMYTAQHLGAASATQWGIGSVAQGRVLAGWRLNSDYSSALPAQVSGLSGTAGGTHPIAWTAGRFTS